MKTNTIHTLLASSALALTLAACSSAPKQIDSLETARAAYDRSSSDTAVIQHAQPELDAARKALSEADRLWKEKADKSEVEHYASLVSQKLNTAKLVTDSKLAEAQLGSKKAKQQETEAKLEQTRKERAVASAAEEQKKVNDMQGSYTPRGIVVTLSHVLFVDRSGTLTGASDYVLTKVAKFLEENKDQKIVVEGHTDDQGNDDDNLDLSRERAYAVRSDLVARGIDADRITARGFGESSPKHANTSVANRELNRRVEIVLPK